MASNTPQKPKRPILQLLVGLHRSGTSVTTQILSLQSLDLGRTLMLPSFDNTRGFWENSLVVGAHDELLNALGCDWTTAAGLPPQWQETEAADVAVERLVKIIEKDFSAGANKLIKDPRMAVLLPIWDRVAELSGHELHVMAVLRDPIDVGASIMRRNTLNKTDVDLILGSQLAAMSENLSPRRPPVLLYEKLTMRNGTEILSGLAEKLPHLKFDQSSNMAAMVSRLVTYRHRKPANSEFNPYQALFDASGDEIIVDWDLPGDYLETEVADFDAVKLLQKRETLLPREEFTVEIDRRRLETLRSAEDAKIGLEAAYRRLEGEFEEKSATLSSYVLKADTLSKKIELLNDDGKNDFLAEARVKNIAGAILAQKTKVDQMALTIIDMEDRNERYAAEEERLRLKIEHLGDVEAKLSQKLVKQEKTLKSKNNSVTKVKTTLSETMNDLEHAQDQIQNLKSERKALKADLSQVEKDAQRFARNLKSTKTRHARKLAKIKEKSQFLQNSVGTLKANMLAAQASDEENRKLATERLEKLIEINQKLFDLREALQNSEQKLSETGRIREMQDVTIEMENLRTRMIDEYNAAHILSLQNRLDFYESAPIRAGLKRSMFKILQSIRHKTPLPEQFKLSTARRLTGLAQRLNPPAQQIDNSVISTPDDTINFAFKETNKPVISIIVPVYNEISQTIACLKSIFQQRVSVDYEVIVADDASPDPFHDIFNTVPGLRYIRHPENLHFLLNCNRAAEQARGDYLVFLNNDTIVKPDWLEKLYTTFDEHGNVGIVGSKLVFPTGELQEAGGIIWEDASGWNWGRGQNANHPLYNFVRDVDYVSGASLMISHSLWKEIGGFNEDLEKAYYEDTDICFKVRDMGLRVLYQPQSVVVHIEGLSSGTDLNSGAKQYQLVNQNIFKDRWADTLRYHLPNAQTPLLASDRKVRGHVLYIDAVTPEPDKDSGSLDAVFAMRILVEQGYRVHFIPGSNFAYWGSATQKLQSMGIECIYHPFYSNLEAFLDERGDMFEFAVVSRAECADLYIDKVRALCPSAKIVYNTVDLHFLRMQRRAKTTGDKKVAEQAELMRVKEMSFIKKSDATIILSYVEHDLLVKEGVPEDKLWIIPLIRATATRLVEYETTQDMVFIGGYRHPPNVDAVEWMMDEIWPIIEARLPDVKLRICGSSMPDEFQDYASERVVIQGFVPDLDGLLSKTRLTLAPLRFGAGLKGKVASSIGAGVPCVGTSIAFEGMAEEGLSYIKLESDDPEAFANIAIETYTDQEKWDIISHLGVEYHNENYAYQNVAKTYAKMLRGLNGDIEPETPVEKPSKKATQKNKDKKNLAKKATGKKLPKKGKGKNPPKTGAGKMAEET